MELPFKIGEIVFDEYFTNRSQEIERIRTAMLSRGRLLVSGERRHGKSSAIRQASLRLEERGAVILWVDLWTTESLGEVVRRIVSAIPYSWSLRERIQLLLAGLGLEPTVTMDVHGRPALGLGIQTRSLTEEEARERFLSLMKGLDKLAADHTEPVVLVLDEFQEIESIVKNGGGLLRAAAQDTPHLAYIFAGSALSLVQRLTNAKGPFYNISRLEVGPLDPDELGPWMEDRMRTHGVQPERGVGRTIIEVAGPRTEDCIRLAKGCHLRSLGRGRIAIGEVQKAFDDVVGEGAGTFELLWRKLPAYQKAVLRAMAAGVVELHGRSARETHRLPASSSIAKALNILREEGYVTHGDPPAIADPFLRAWILRSAYPNGRP